MDQGRPPFVLDHSRIGQGIYVKDIYTKGVKVLLGPGLQAIFLESTNAIWTLCQTQNLTLKCILSSKPRPCS